MTRRFGTVAPNGATYFSSEDLNEVRHFLWDNGLNIWRDKPVWRGWCSADDTRYGAIYFSDGQFHGMYRVRS